MTRQEANRAIDALRQIVHAAEAADRDGDRFTGEWGRWEAFRDLIAQGRAALTDIDARPARRRLFGDLSAEFIQELLTSPPRKDAAE